MKHLLSVFLVGALVSPALVDAQYRSGCWESRSICADIEDLGDDEIEEFPNPVILDSNADELVDTWGAARSSGGHEGTDILAPEGSLIVMPTDGVVDRTGVSGYGGKHVFVYIGGGEKLYFAHLDDWADGLDEGDVLEKGDLVGYVGNTGAEYAPHHLHLTIYKDGVADNAYPRMTDTDWTLEEKMESLDAVFRNEDDDDLVEQIYRDYRSLFDEARDEDIRLPRAIRNFIDDAEEAQESAVEEALEELAEQIAASQEAATKGSDLDEARKFSEFNEDLSASRGDSDEIERLQKFLNDVEGARIDENGVFDQDTLEAVQEFQEKYSREILEIWGLDEATGYVGITTRLKINFLINASEQTQCPVFSQYNSRTQNTSSDEVLETEELLADLGFFSGTPDREWDYATHRAMVAFQERFAATMLTPWGISTGTGYKYKTTNKFMNYLVGCDTPAVELDGRGEFDF